MNLHPFHTLHVRAVAQQFPHARLYGTPRHKALAPELRWEPLHTDDAALHGLFADDFRFSVPRGVDLVPASDHLHFSSVLALHRATGTLPRSFAPGRRNCSSCGDVKHICTAHARPLPPSDRSAVERVRGALGHVSKLLDAHERRYG